MTGVALCAAISTAAPLNVRDYGAVGDGVTDDTAAIQAAVIAAGTNGAVIDFPAGTYVVSLVRVRPGATFRTRPGDARAVIRTKPDSGKFTRNFTTTFDRYFGATDSPPLAFSNLEFDGNLANQGPYRNYELEHQAGIFAMAHKDSPGRLTLLVENCDFHDGAADAIGVSDNVHATITNCTTFEYFRGGITCGSGGTEIHIADFVSGGVSNRAGLQIEVDSAGYNGNMGVDITAENVDLDGGFDIGFLQGGSFTGSNILLRKGPFFLFAKGATVRIRDSVFYAGATSRSHLYYPHDVAFENCRFIASREPDDTVTEYSPTRVYFVLASSGARSNQVCTFRSCAWELGEGFLPGDIRKAVYLSADRISLNNRLVIEDSTIAPGYEYGVYVNQGGAQTLRNLEIGANEAIHLGASGTYGDYYLDSLLENVTFVNGVTTSEFLTWDSPSNRITHQNMTLDESMNRLGTSYGVTDNTYFGGRLILGVEPPVNTPGLLGDEYRLKIPLPNQVSAWRCTASHQTAATWEADPGSVPGLAPVSFLCRAQTGQTNVHAYGSTTNDGAAFLTTLGYAGSNARVKGNQHVGPHDYSGGSLADAWLSDGTAIALKAYANDNAIVWNPATGQTLFTNNLGGPSYTYDHIAPLPRLTGLVYGDIPAGSVAALDDYGSGDCVAVFERTHNDFALRFRLSLGANLHAGLTKNVDYFGEPGGNRYLASSLLNGTIIAACSGTTNVWLINPDSGIAAGGAVSPDIGLLQGILALPDGEIGFVGSGRAIRCYAPVYSGTNAPVLGPVVRSVNLPDTHGAWVTDACAFRDGTIGLLIGRGQYPSGDGVFGGAVNSGKDVLQRWDLGGNFLGSLSTAFDRCGHVAGDSAVPPTQSRATLLVVR